MNNTNVDNSKNEYKSLNLLTLVIPTHNRNYYLSRCLHYHAQYPYGEIIVADSSDENKRQKNESIIQKISLAYGRKIRHITYNQKLGKYGNGFFWKWGDGIQSANTRYSQICTDKEFSIPLTQCKCIEFLEENPEFSTCEGEYYYIEKDNSKKYTKRNMYPTQISLLESDATKRLNAATKGKNISSNLMGVRKTDIHKSIYNTLENFGINDIRFSEFTIEFLTIIWGKTMHIDSPYCYRDISKLVDNTKFKKTESSSLQHPYLDSYIKEGIYDSYFERFVNCLAPEISKNSALTLSEAESFVNTELPKIIKMRGFYGNTKFTQDPLWYIWRHAPSFMKNLGGYIIPKKYLDYKEISTPEEKYITNIIEKTKHLHATDSPIDESILSEEMGLN